MIRVLAVCGMGLGTSVILKSRLKEALDREGVDYTLEVTDAGSVRGQAADVIFTSDELADRVRNRDAKVVIIKNFTSREEVGEKVRAAVAEMGG
jgi:ascorbate PTS system EIIB component